MDPKQPTSPPTQARDLLVEQLEWHWTNQLRPRLDGLTDAEYLWEPAAGAWSVRPGGGDAPTSPLAVNPAAPTTIDFAYPEPDPAPVTTIAWRLAHVIVGCLGARLANHFGGPAVDYATFPYALTAAGALAQLDEAYSAWTSALRSLDDAALSLPVGPTEGPWSEHSMGTLVAHINREVIHHGAEVCLLRDLYAHRAEPGSASDRP
ncbi:DinB family protein [Corynebacterium sp. NPDC060344]|uniref:DinB family protein n=1 Tax=Corynebacterium sp. NPDC060344 TaxID=3347101 RepID=UPI00365E55E3